MDLETVLAKLAEEDRAAVVAAIEAEKAAGIQAARKRGEDVNKLLAKYKPIESALQEAGFNLEDSIEEQIAKLTGKAGQKMTEADKELKALKTQIKELTEKAAAKEAIEAKYKTSRLTEALQKMIGEKVHASDFVVKNLIAEGRVRLNDQDSPVWVDSDDIEVDVSKGIESFLKANPAIVRNSQQPGAGGKPSSGGNQGNQQQAFSPLQMLRMK